MKSINFASLMLFISVIIISAVLGGREINAKIKDTVRENFQSEIDQLKEKLSKQSELLQSMIELSKNGSASENENQPTQSVQSADFEYENENGTLTITKYIGKATDVTVPDEIDGLPVKRIGKYAFADTRVKSVSLPSSCTEIDWFAFYGCFALTSVTVPESVASIGYGAFDSCSKALTLYCVNGSYAEQYADSFGMNYKN